MKTLFLVADGMGDWPLDQLGGKTPMAEADTPNMDQLAATGMVGRASTIPQGFQPGSDVANMSLIGFDPATYHTGRGPIEAAAQGLQLYPEDLVWRMNLVTLSKLDPNGIMRDYSAGHIDTEQSTPLVEMLQQKLGNQTFQFVPGIQYRHLLVQKGGADSDEAMLDVDPPHDITDQSINRSMRRFSRSPELWDLVHEAAELLDTPLNKSRANAIWPWGQGSPLLLPDFEETFGMKGAVISAVDLVKGLGRASGMKVVDVEGATGLLDTNYAGKVQAALDFLQDGDFAFVHLEGPDEAGHGGSIEEKTEAIRRFDTQVLAPLRDGLKGEDVTWIIACDHYTPIATKTHTVDPVPFIVHFPGCEASGVERFTEDTADSTGLKLEKGHELLSWALKQAAR